MTEEEETIGNKSSNHNHHHQPSSSYSNPDQSNSHVHPLPNPPPNNLKDFNNNSINTRNVQENSSKSWSKGSQKAHSSSLSSFPNPLLIITLILISFSPASCQSFDLIDHRGNDFFAFEDLFNARSLPIRRPGPPPQARPPFFRPGNSNNFHHDSNDETMERHFHSEPRISEPRIPAVREPRRTISRPVIRDRPDFFPPNNIGPWAFNNASSSESFLSRALPDSRNNGLRFNNFEGNSNNNDFGGSPRMEPLVFGPRSNNDFRPRDNDLPRPSFRRPSFTFSRPTNSPPIDFRRNINNNFNVPPIVPPTVTPRRPPFEQPTPNSIRLPPAAPTGSTSISLAPRNLPTTNVNSLLLPQSCLNCLCSASTGCDLNKKCVGDFCGPYLISWPYWADGGKPGTDYVSCALNKKCAEDAIQGYMKKWQRDCNGDGIVDCDDYAAIHKLGPHMCRSDSVTGTDYWKNYEKCDANSRNDRNDERFNNVITSRIGSQSPNPSPVPLSNSHVHGHHYNSAYPPSDSHASGSASNHDPTSVLPLNSLVDIVREAIEGVDPRSNDITPLSSRSNNDNNRNDIHGNNLPPVPVVGSNRNFASNNDHNSNYINTIDGNNARPSSFFNDRIKPQFVDPSQPSTIARHPSPGAGRGGGVGIIGGGGNNLGTGHGGTHLITTPRPDLPLITPRRRLQSPSPTTTNGPSRTGRSGNTFFESSTNNLDKATHIEVTKECMSCICDASSGCNMGIQCSPDDRDQSKRCGPYQLDRNYWFAAGKPGFRGNSIDFEKCSNDKDCSEETVSRFLRKMTYDCNEDGVIDCLDFAAIHKGGPKACNSQWFLESKFWTEFQQCYGFSRRK